MGTHTAQSARVNPDSTIPGLSVIGNSVVVLGKGAGRVIVHRRSYDNLKVILGKKSVADHSLERHVAKTPFSRGGLKLHFEYLDPVCVCVCVYMYRSQGRGSSTCCKDPQSLLRLSVIANTCTVHCFLQLCCRGEGSFWEGGGVYFISVALCILFSLFCLQSL